MAMEDQALMYEQHQKTKSLKRESADIKLLLKQTQEMVYANYQSLDDLRERLEEIEQSLPALIE